MIWSSSLENRYKVFDEPKDSKGKANLPHFYKHFLRYEAKATASSVFSNVDSELDLNAERKRLKARF